MFFLSLGTDKSSIFVAMCILIQQLRLEKKVDICTTTRKLRSQRNLMIDSYVSDPFLTIFIYFLTHFLSILDFLSQILTFLIYYSHFQAQYEFLHRAIVNYADLHKSSLDSITSAIADS